MEYKDEKISVFGGYGFVLGELCNKYENETDRLERDNYMPSTRRILYGISTVHNYNVFDNPFLDVDTNLSVLIKVLENCRNKYGSDFEFNFVSSWFVYGNTMLPATEESHCDPKGFYSITKRCAEQLLISYCETYGIRYRILRLANVLGASDRKSSPKKNALQFMIRQIMAHQPITVYYGGKFFRDYIDVRDAIDAIYLILCTGDYGTYNVSNGHPTMFVDTITKIVELSRSQSLIDTTDDTPFHAAVQVRSMYMSNLKLRKLGYEPTYSLENTLKDIIDAYANERANPTTG